MRALALAALACLVAVATPGDAAAQESSFVGEWSFVLNSPEGSFDIPLVLTRDGETVTASLPPDVGEEGGDDFTMRGTVRGERIRLHTEVSWQGTPLEMDLSGTISGDRMSGSVDYGGLARDSWSATRVTADDP